MVFHFGTESFSKRCAGLSLLSFRLLWALQPKDNRPGCGALSDLFRLNEILTTIRRRFLHPTCRSSCESSSSTGYFMKMPFIWVHSSPIYWAATSVTITCSITDLPLNEEIRGFSVRLSPSLRQEPLRRICAFFNWSIFLLLDTVASILISSVGFRTASTFRN